MKKIILPLAFIALTSLGVVAQEKGSVGIGTNSPSPDLILDIQSSKPTAGPRVTEATRISMKNPQIGYEYFQVDEESGKYIYTGKRWVRTLTTDDLQDIQEAKAVAAANADNWSKTGDAGTNPSVNFLGTTDNQPLILKVNNQRNAFFDNSAYNNLFLGRLSGISSTPTGTPATAGSGSYNVGVGASSLVSLTTGFGNVGVGFGAIANLSTGSDNLAFGNSALYNNLTGSNNVAIGAGALFNNTGSSNLAVGAYALSNSGNGIGNIAIGDAAGGGASGNNNIFLGFNSGFSESGSNKLYIANSSTITPLIYGDFSAKYVTIGDVSPALRSQGVATGGYNLLVKGGILTEKVKVALATAGTDWADYVFEPEYKANMMSLEDIEKFTIEHKHLPNVPSSEEMVKSGLDVAQTSKMFMEKIEELTIYIIEMDKKIKLLEQQSLANKK